MHTDPVTRPKWAVFDPWPDLVYSFYSRLVSIWSKDESCTLIPWHDLDKTADPMTWSSGLCGLTRDMHRFNMHSVKTIWQPHFNCATPSVNLINTNKHTDSHTDTHGHTYRRTHTMIGRLRDKQLFRSTIIVNSTLYTVHCKTFSFLHIQTDRQTDRQR